MGDLLMSAPAMRAVKETLSCRITVLISSMAAALVPFIPEIDDFIVADLPWVKNESEFSSAAFSDLIDQLKRREFDGALIFTVYSQNPLPAALLCCLAGIPRRVAYCRENPYQLLTCWLPDPEPYSLIRHQVRRDLDMVKMIGCVSTDHQLALRMDPGCLKRLQTKLQSAGALMEKPFIVLHAGVSEKKREYPEEKWIEIGRQLQKGFRGQIFLSGVSSERALALRLKEGIGLGCLSLAGELNLEEFICLVKHASLVISVNTSTIHIAAATRTPLIVLYALTNPQHAPWGASGRIFPFQIPESIRSKNQVIDFVNKRYFKRQAAVPSPQEVVNEALIILRSKNRKAMPELVYPQAD